jgi:broad specificity phosphatase PhoE
MRTLEIRRHSLRERPNPHLSAEGIALARRVGAEIGPFDLVVTSPVTRAVETAVAMGFAIDETSEELGLSPEAIASFRVCGEGASFAETRAAAQSESVCATLAAMLARAWREIAGRLEEGQTALIVTHGHLIETGALALLPQASVSEWGGAIAECEGVRLHFEGEDCTGGEVLRVSLD